MVQLAVAPPAVCSKHSKPVGATAEQPLVSVCCPASMLSLESGLDVRQLGRALGVKVLIWYCHCGCMLLASSAGLSIEDWQGREMQDEHEHPSRLDLRV